ncbi:hypothetical protein D9758_008629 [Tetrapyrgos nigripes]|uniref:DUF6534 domain-containing protein n=1 Tax=Tetrapyrgos nigripes TaxID=182062 RepID=A0A8H5D4X5_9AGAR|nr:hypothetical protein D9758_008629 [Tetrapyrgos nigripes]
MIIAANYNHLIKRFGDLDQFHHVSPEIIWLLLPTTLIALTVQSFFVWRIWLFDSKKYRIPVALGIGMAFQLGGNIYTLYVGQNVKNLAQLWAADHVMLAYYAIAACVDVLISAMMIYLLWRRRITDEDVQFNHTSRIIYRLTILSVNSGLWTAVFAIGVLILSVIFDSGLQFSICYFPLAHLYSNCLLANLTTRNYIKTSGEPDLTTLGAFNNVIHLSARSDQDVHDGSESVPRVIISTEIRKRSDLDATAIPDPRYKHDDVAHCSV